MDIKKRDRATGVKQLNKTGVFVFILLSVLALSGCERDIEPEPPPEAPQNLELDPSGPHHVKLTWTSASSKKERFVIQRSDNGNKFARIAEVSPRAHEFIDDGVSPDTSYIYRVYAENHFHRSEPVASEEYRHPYLDACNSPSPTYQGTTATFYDFPVSGLNYTNGSTYSITDGNGAFEWDQASDIRFSLGYVDIGYLKAGDKAGLWPLSRNSGDTTNTTLNNLLRLLFVLDEDGDPVNGIQLPCDMSLAYGEINPSTDYDTFAQQETVIRLAGGTPLPSQSTVRTLYLHQLFRDYTGHYELTWGIFSYGQLVLSATIPFDLNKNGTIQNTGESIVEASINPHDDYHLHIVDLAALLLVELGYYELEIDANIKPDYTLEGEVVLKSFLLGDSKGKVWGGRVE